MAQQLPSFPNGLFQEFVDSLNAQLRESNRTPEEEFAALEVQIGDRIRLTEVTRQTFPYGVSRRAAPKDAAVLEGKVLDIKVRGGKSQVRVSGFGHAGPRKNGGQHVWFAVEDYKVDVLHKVYRLTDEDRLIAAVAGLSENAWVEMTDHTRAAHRRTYGPRAERIRNLLQD